MRVAIVGAAGGVGSAAAFALVLRGGIDELLLVDPQEGLVRSHVMDLEQLTITGKPVAVRAAPAVEVTDAEVALVCASSPHKDGRPRSHQLAGNVRILDELLGPLAECLDRGGRVIVASNPVDALCTWLHERTGAPQGAILGYTLNDTTRLRFAVARALGVEARRVSAWSLGEHGERTVPILSRVRVDGAPVRLYPDQARAVTSYTRSWYDNWQRCGSGRTSTWMSGWGLADVVGALVDGREEPLPASVLLRGEFGIDGVCLSVPLAVEGPAVRVLEWPLDPGERVALHAAAVAVARAAGPLTASDFETRRDTQCT